MPGIIIKLFAFAVAVTLALFAGANAFRSARRLNGAIREFQEEQDNAASIPGPIDPYATYAVASKRAAESAQPPKNR